MHIIILAKFVDSVTDDFKLERYGWLLEFELYYFLLFSLQISRKLSMWWKVLFQCFQAE